MKTDSIVAGGGWKKEPELQRRFMKLKAELLLMMGVICCMLEWVSVDTLYFGFLLIAGALFLFLSCALFAVEKPGYTVRLHVLTDGWK